MASHRNMSHHFPTLRTRILPARVVAVLLLAVLAILPCKATGISGLTAVNFAADPDSAASALPDTIMLGAPLIHPSEVVESEIINQGDSLRIIPIDSAAIYDSPALVTMPDDSLRRAAESSPLRVFNPNPTRAVWMSALFPGLGQIYNRRYWKLPIVVGAYLGIGYGLSWNNMMLGDYTRAYNDITDNDPNTKSYMDFFPSTVSESSLDKQWLTNLLKNNKDYCRRNRDLCIIAMVGVYLVAMVDAYVDASLAHFDISPDLALQWAPAVIPGDRCKYPSVGLQWAFIF